MAEQATGNAPKAAEDDGFAEWLKANPGGTFSQYSMTTVAARIRAGSSHQTLGPKLTFDGDWWDAGRQMYDTLLDVCPFPETAKVCDYGCGSLRVGVHFLMRQPPESFIGLDVTEDFINYGKEIIGDDILGDKRPKFGTIAASVSEAQAMNVDVVYATLVAHHVHPDEKAEFFENMKSIAHKSGSLAIFNVYFAPEPIRYQQSGWAWPRAFYMSSMEPFELVAEKALGTVERGGHTIRGFMLAFRRP